MSAPNSASSPSPQTPAKGSRVFKSKSSSQSKSDWLAASLTTAKVTAAGAECIPFPYVKGVFGTVVVILETVEKAKRNRDDLKELCGDSVEIIKIIQEQLVAHRDTGALKFKGLCEDLASVLEGVFQSIKQLLTESRGLSGCFKKVVKLGSTADKIAGYRMRIQLTAAIDTNLQVYKAFSTGRLPDSSAAIVTQTITKCPPPSRIFHGRQNILDKMYQFFEQDLDKQHIYLLHGLGGAGKTQIALKFIEELSAHFSDIFLIDTSTTETIDTGLKNIATTQNAGSTAQDSLKWLSSTTVNWLLFFDNADDPNINLNKIFPRCKQGNILITSRNPSLRVYAGGYSLVSDMEEPDAVDLLLTSAAQAITPGNKEIAAEIVKALYHLPLAIIQAGAFISESGAPDGYLALYVENRDQLLSEKPAQSHDDYAWTVYTTWNISFQKLSKSAATILQLCSFLHHKGISVEIFSRASVYDFPLHGPLKAEVHKPLEFLSQFLGPTNTWDSFRFLKVMNEIKAYSLVSFDRDGKLYSIHPLVHHWSRSTLTDQEQYHDWMVAIVGMSISGIPHHNLQLASLKLLPHVDSLLCGNTNIRPNFWSGYGRLYYYAKRLKDAEQLYIAALEHRRSVLGEDHLDTLYAVGVLASTYTRLGKLQEAEELEVVVLEKRRKILGEDHLQTLVTMGNLASTYYNLGKLQEAEELQVGVVEKRRKILGDDHPETLRAMGNLASTYHKLAKLQEAEELGVVVLEKQRKILGEDHSNTLDAMQDLAATCYHMNKFKEAEQFYVELLDRQTALLGADHPDTLEAANNLSITHQAVENKQRKSVRQFPVLHPLPASTPVVSGSF
ncbi:P-loop containing nucleoside triphosphate hydrolase protein [Mycena vulgaris]|nr:P-loop containing nucleoside triphosphate hydrolase protein [Mycena vulgaris]